MDPMLAWGLGLLALAFLLLILELFVPSAGALAVGAGLAAIAGVVCLFRYDAAWGASGALSILVLTPLAVYGFFKIWPNTPMGRRIIGAPTEEQVMAQRQAEERARAQRQALIGKEGKVVTDLRPVGLVDIGGTRYEVLSETLFVPAGSRVRITQADLSQIKVRPVT